MTTNTNLFYLRQFSHLLGKDITIATAFEKMVSQVPAVQKNLWLKAQDDFNRNINLISALSHIDPQGANTLTKQLKYGQELGIKPQNILSNSSELILQRSQMATLIKSRLQKVLGYSALISLVTLIVIFVYQLYTLPLFEVVILEQGSSSQQGSEFMNNLISSPISWIILYGIPLSLVATYIYFYLKPIESIIDSKLLLKTPFIKGIVKQITKVTFIRTLSNHYSILSSDSHTRKEQLESPFFTANERYTFSQLFTEQEKDELEVLFELNTFEQESANLVTQIEINAIESIHSKASAFSIGLHFILILIVAQVLIRVYSTIFQLGAIF